jgi:hypothetical protein
MDLMYPGRHIDFQFSLRDSIGERLRYPYLVL